MLLVRRPCCVPRSNLGINSSRTVEREVESEKVVNKRLGIVVE